MKTIFLEAKIIHLSKVNKGIIVPKFRVERSGFRSLFNPEPLNLEP